jgi:tetraacyldisaccharide 4'-kinase
MKAPAFWYQKPGFLSNLLLPLGWVYGKVVKVISSLKSPQKFQIPILSIGNIVSGGSGKTPTAIALAELLKDKGLKIHFVTRGYKGSERGPVLVDPLKHSFHEVGDEPLLLAQHAPTWVAKDRPRGIQSAQEMGADLIILDDGHQTNSVHKDLSFVVVDSLQRFGNERVIPAGPLREDLAEGLSKADAIISVGGEGDYIPETFVAFAQTKPLKLGKVVAFCGLGFPQKFYNSLKEQGVDIVTFESFPDHHSYQEKALEMLASQASQHNAELVTTRKDWVRLPGSWQHRVHVLDMQIQFEKPEHVYRFILNKVANP